MKLCVLGSGSKGHAVYVEAGGKRLLFDAGFSARELKRRLAAIDRTIDDLDAIIISHEHRDHIAGLRVLGRQKPVYATPGAHAYLARHFPIDQPRPIDPGADLDLDGLAITLTPTSHDAREPVAFIIDDGHVRAAIVTDLGVVTHPVLHHLHDLDLAVLESNHDEIMLRDGPYPWDLKQRIKSRHGHLSNDQCAQLLAAIRSPRLQTVLLAHLSETNNRPAIARDSALLALDNSPCAVHVCDQHRATDVFVIE